jgi:hypothetical protein
MIELEVCMTTQSWVNREYRRGLRTHLCGGSSVEDQRGGDVVTYPHQLGMAHQEVQYPVAQGGVETQGLELDDEFGGYYVVKC